MGTGIWAARSEVGNLAAGAHPFSAAQPLWVPRRSGSIPSVGGFHYTVDLGSSRSPASPGRSCPMASNNRAHGFETSALYNSPVIAGRLLEAAHKYRRCGISILPIAQGTKLPDADALSASGCVDLLRRPSWLALSRRLPTDLELESWFEARSCGLGMVTGYRGLLVLDFDAASDFEQWSRRNNALARLAPTQKTARGFHVLFRWRGVWRIHLFTHNGFRLLGAAGSGRIGELKGTRDYVVAWPSIHPDGVPYAWLPGKSPWEMDVPTIVNLKQIGVAPVSTLLRGYASSISRLLADPRRRLPEIGRHILNRYRRVTGTFFRNPP